jgi:molecular chaperone DnaK
MQGEHEKGEENELLGEFVLTDLRKAAKGQVEIEVTFEINADGIVSVNAKDLETGRTQAIQVTATSGLTQQELKQMIDSSQGEMLERRASEEEEGTKQEAQRLIAEIDKLFPQVEQIVASSDFGRDATEKARGILQKARAAVAKGDHAAIKEHMEALGRTARMFRGVVQKTS